MLLVFVMVAAVHLLLSLRLCDPMAAIGMVGHCFELLFLRGSAWEIL